MNLSDFLSVSISSDKNSATVKIVDIPQNKNAISSDVVDCLRSSGVTTGYKLLEVSNVLRSLNEGLKGKEFVVAEGKPKEEGVDGFEEFRFRTKLLAGAEGGQKVDFKERGLINNVRQGQILAIQKPHISGKPGLLVNGDKDEPNPVKQVKPLKAGINVEQFEKNGEITFVSMIAGHARKLFDEIQVSPDYIVNGDLDFTKGNIDFVGNVEIMGDVKSGFKVIAGGDIVIGGDIEPEAIIKSDGNITVRGNIRTGKKGKNLFCKGDITSGNIINSYIECDGNVYLKELLSDSMVFCKGKFLSSWGVILGSTIEAIGGIVLNNVGKDDSTSKNILYSGEAYQTQERVSAIKDKLEDCNNQLSLITKQVAIEKSSETTEENEARSKNIAKARTEHAKQLKEEIEQLSIELDNLKPKLVVNREAKVEIKGKIYPTCVIKIGNNEINVIDEKRNSLILEYDPSSEENEEP